LFAEVTGDAPLRVLNGAPGASQPITAGTNGTLAFDLRLMQLTGRMRRWCGLQLELLLLVFTVCCTSAATPKRVLMVFREGSDVPADIMIAQAVRANLGERDGSDVEIYKEYLDDNRFGGVGHHGLFLDYLREKYRERLPDVIVTTVGFAATGLRHFEPIPGIPVVSIWAFNTAPNQPMSLGGTNATGVAASFDYRGTLDLILRLQPDTRRIVVIGGVDSSSRGLVHEVGKTSLLYSNRVDFEYWTNQPMAELKAGVSGLPNGTVVLYTAIFRDVSGGAFVPAQALEQLVQQASVPTYVLMDSQFGTGAVGGSVLSYSELGAQAGELARSILDGTSVANLPVRVLTNSTPLFDWRALQRWGISESRLPPGSIIEFREPSFWELYWGRILAVVLLCSLQTGLIIALLVNRAKRREAQAVSALIADLSSKFVNLPAGEVDREIEQAQRRVCEHLGLDLSSLWQASPESGRFLTLTHVYRPLGGPPLPERMGAEEYFPWSLKQLMAGRTVAISSVEEVPAEAARDQASWRHFGVRASLCIPLSAGGGPIMGALSFNTMQAERTWPGAIVQQLKLVAQIFANALARKRADQALRASEARLSLAAESAGVGLWSLDLGTGCLWVTEKTRELVGFSADEVVTLDRFLSLVHPEDQDLIRQTIQTVVQSKQEGHVEYRVAGPDGSVRWISSRGGVTAKTTGQADHLMGVSVDITERKAAEARLKESRARLAAAVDIAALGFYEIQGSTNKAFIDDRMRSLVGIPDAATHRLREFWNEHLHPDDRERVLALSRQVWEGGLDTVSTQYRYLHPQGNLMWLNHVSHVVERDSQGRVVRLFGVIRDVTEQKRAEAALKESVGRFKQVVDFVGEFIWEVDANGLYTYASPSVKKILEYTREELVGRKHFYDLFEPSVRESLKAAALQVFLNKQAFRDFPNANLTKGGKIVHLETSGIPMLDPAGNLMGYRGADTDVTAQRRAEKETRELRSSLAHSDRVTLLGQLASALAHELSQPLGAILRNAEAAELMLQEPAPDLEELRAIVTDIRLDDQRAGNVIDHLRSLLKRRSLDLQPVELNGVITEVLSLVQADAAGRHVKLVCSAAPELPNVRGDRVHLQQVLLNLLVNAMDAVGGVATEARKVQVTTHRADGLVEIRVFDNGPGISGGSPERLFEPFYTTKANGMGMGLAVSRTIIEAHKGRIWAENRPEGGACFCFTLPVAEGETPGPTGK